MPCRNRKKLPNVILKEAMSRVCSGSFGAGRLQEEMIPLRESFRMRFPTSWQEVFLLMPSIKPEIKSVSARQATRDSLATQTREKSTVDSDIGISGNSVSSRSYMKVYAFLTPD